MLMLKKMKARDLEIPDWLGLTPQCVSLLTRLLDPDPDTRVGIDAIMRVRLSSGWECGCGWGRGEVRGVRVWAAWQYPARAAYVCKDGCGDVYVRARVRPCVRVRVGVGLYLCRCMCLRGWACRF